MAVSNTGGASSTITPGSGCASEVTLIDWSTDPLSPAPSSVLTDGNTYNIYARGTDTECGTMYYGDPAAANTTPDGVAHTFTWNACTDTSTSTITIPASQTVSGNSVDLTTLYSYSTGTGLDTGSVVYKINGSTVTSPWDSSAFGQFSAEVVTFEVSMTDTDCGTVVTQSQTITVDNSTITPDWGSCTVTTGRQAFPDGQSTMTAAVSITDPTQAFLLVDIGYGSIETNAANGTATGYIQDANTLRFDRYGTTGPNAWVGWQLVECYNNEIYVQRGPITMGAGTATATATLAQTIDPAKSLVIVNSRADDATASQDMMRVRGTLDDGSTVRATRVNTTGNNTTRYQVVTFRNGSGVTLYKGSFAFDSSASASQSHTIPGGPVDPTRSWLYGSWDAANDGLSQTTVGLELTNANTVTAYRYAATNAVNNIEYTVVEFPNDGSVKIQRGAFDESVVDPNAGDDVEGAVPITITTPVSALNKAFSDTYNTTQDTGTAFGRNSWIEQLTDTSTLTISNWRTNNANSLSMQYWQVVEFVSCFDTNGSSVTITSPANGSTVNGSVSIAATRNFANNPTEYRIAGGAWTPIATLWDTTATHPGSTSVPVSGVVVEVRAVEDECGGYVTDSVTVTVDNTCTDSTPSTINIPAGQSVSGSSVDLTTLYSVTGNVGSFTYTINGSPVTSPWDSSSYGTGGPEIVTFTVSGTDPDCGDPVGPVSETITVNNANDTNITGITAVGKDSFIRVQANYSGDVNADNTLLVEWEECTGGLGSCDGTTFTSSSGAIAHAATPYIYDITGLVNFKVYQVRVTFTDADGVTGTNPEVFTDVVPSNPMLHNAASTSSTKWGGSWGLPGGKYGEFTCETCHTDTTTNIKRVKQTISFPDGSVMPNGSTSSSVTFSDTRDGSSDYGDANGAHATSSGVCEVCHTYDGSADPNDGGVRYHAYKMDTATAGEQSHFIQLDCMNCHNHKAGFLPTSCDSCHGDPPTTSDTDGSTNTGLVHTDVTGSTTPGAHQKHAVDLGFACATCHNGYTMPNGGDIDINFYVDFGNGNSTSGSYTGQSGVSYNGSTGSGGLTCNAVYCHGGGIGGTAPAWNGGAMTCGSCHGASQSTPPSTGSHARHVSNLGLDCSVCHGGGYGKDDGTGTSGTAPAGHLNGVVAISMATGSYSKSGTIIAQGMSGASPYGTCSVADCHGAGTPQWGGGSLTCTECHNNGTNDGNLANAVPDTNKHPQHIGNSFYVPNSCDDCHGTGATTGSHNHVTVGDKLGDGVISVGGSLNSYDGTNKNCLNSCHHATSINLWTVGGALNCTDCHSSGTMVPGGANFSGGQSGLHTVSQTGVQKHNDTLSSGCTECHSDTASAPGTHIDGNFTPDNGSNADRFVTRANLTYTQQAPASGRSGSCSGSGLNGCHSDNGAWARLWSTEADSTSTTVGNARCNVCHGQWSSITGSAGWRTGTSHAANATRGETMHDSGTGQPDCNTCHAYQDVTGRHENSLITMNGTGTFFNDDGSNGGCSACHGGETDTARNFPSSVFAFETVAGPTVSAPCTGCHAAGKVGAIVTSSSPHVVRGNKAGFNTFNACEDCHPGGSVGSMHQATGVVGIPNNATVGINYQSGVSGGGSYSGFNGIVLGGDATTGSTEAEICWNCHNNTTYQQTVISEWGVNTDTNGAGSNYDFGSLNQPNWIGATWTSANALNFGYKTGPIQSTHAANDTGGVSGVDSVANIRCSYCHDVHDTYGPSSGTSGPHLRGTWMGNPYKEDGAPVGAWNYYASNQPFGPVPRGYQSTNANLLGGWQIDQNNGNPTNGNPTNGWTANGSAGLCELCHGNGDGAWSASEINTLNKFGTASNDWVGNNGHANAVLGGDGTGKANIYNPSTRGEGTNWRSPKMGYQMGGSGGSDGDRIDRMYGLRNYNGNTSSWSTGDMTADNNAGVFPYAHSPNQGKVRYAYQYGDPGYNSVWGVDQSTTTAQTQYHKFSCSKCHNPHASRLPRLMITNCLDVRHNTWDDNFINDPDWTSGASKAGTENWSTNGAMSVSTSKELAYAKSAQNCHRYINGVEPGWNNVTPW